MEYITNHKKVILLISLLLFLTLGAVFVNQLLVLKKAHSTFENYYVFRGCMKLLEKQADYGKCIIKSGETIKIVKYQGKWYLDGDLPIYRFNFL